MNEHTLGPWRPVTDGISHWVEIDGVIVMVMNYRNKQAQANARLISAAPELLGCVLDVLDADGDPYAMDFNRYRAAIAKATREDKA